MYFRLDWHPGYLYSFPIGPYMLWSAELFSLTGKSFQCPTVAQKQRHWCVCEYVCGSRYVFCTSFEICFGFKFRNSTEACFVKRNLHVHTVCKVMSVHVVPRTDELMCTDLRKCFPVVMSPLYAFELLFFAVFGQTTYDELTTKRPRIPNDPNPPEPYRPLWTDNLFKVAFGIYMLVSVVVLINLLIAMMSDTYQRIQVIRCLLFVFQSLRAR